nr:hypothetical protein BaRGS_020363 [Batillaria attramentaria]
MRVSPGAVTAANENVNKNMEKRTKQSFDDAALTAFIEADIHRKGGTSRAVRGVLMDDCTSTQSPDHLKTREGGGGGRGGRGSSFGLRFSILLTGCLKLTTGGGERTSPTSRVCAKDDTGKLTEGREGSPVSLVERTNVMNAEETSTSLSSISERTCNRNDNMKPTDRDSSDVTTTQHRTSSMSSATSFSRSFGKQNRNKAEKMSLLPPSCAQDTLSQKSNKSRTYSIRQMARMRFDSAKRKKFIPTFSWRPTTVWEVVDRYGMPV